jgi:hypothetical protein
MDTDFELNDGMGTAISKLKNNPRYSDIEVDIDYDTLIDDEQTQLNEPVNSINMSQMARNLENELDNLDKKEDVEVVDTIKVSNMVQPTKPKQNKEKTVEHFNLNNIYSDYKDIILIVLIFMLLNNKFIIELIYRIPVLNRFNNPYINLLLRASIFGGIMYYIKTKNL